MKISMTVFQLILMVIPIALFANPVSADRFDIESTAVKTKYTIEVVVPAGTPESESRYPIIYCMDWFMLGDYLKSLPRMMALGRLAEPYIMVGITQGDTSNDWVMMRTRDFTPAHPTDEYSIRNTYAAAMDLTGGAEKFTRFLKDELIPLVESKYPCDPNRRCFAGYSLGSLLGVHIMTTDPGMFQYYLMGSPSLWFNNYYLGEAIHEMPQERLQSVQKIYISVGEEESWEMLKSFDMLRHAFKEKGFDTSKVKAEIIPASGHVGAMPTALYNGIRYLFRK